MCADMYSFLFFILKIHSPIPNAHRIPGLRAMNNLSEL